MSAQSTLRCPRRVAPHGPGAVPARRPDMAWQWLSGLALFGRAKGQNSLDSGARGGVKCFFFWNRLLCALGYRTPCSTSGMCMVDFTCVAVVLIAVCFLTIPHNLNHCCVSPSPGVGYMARQGAVSKLRERNSSMVALEFASCIGYPCIDSMRGS